MLFCSKLNLMLSYQTFSKVFDILRITFNLITAIKRSVNFMNYWYWDLRILIWLILIDQLFFITSLLFDQQKNLFILDRIIGKSIYNDFFDRFFEKFHIKLFLTELLLFQWTFAIFIKYDTLRNLVQFLQFKKRENLLKISLLHRYFFTFFKLYK